MRDLIILVAPWGPVEKNYALSSYVQLDRA